MQLVSEPSPQKEESELTKYGDDEMQIKTQVMSHVHIKLNIHKKFMQKPQ
jgi:hypothetical protein